MSEIKWSKKIFSVLKEKRRLRIPSYISSRRQTIFSKRMAEPSIQVKVRQFLLYLIRTNGLRMVDSPHRSKDPAEAFKAIFAAGKKARIFFHNRFQKLVSKSSRLSIWKPYVYRSLSFDFSYPSDHFQRICPALGIGIGCWYARALQWLCSSLLLATKRKKGTGTVVDWWASPLHYGLLGLRPINKGKAVVE